VWSDPNAQCAQCANNPGNYNLYVNGTIFASSYSGSDQRWKKNVTPIDNALSLIERLQGVRFEGKTEEYKDRHFEKGVQVGMIAQEVEQVLPEIVRADQDGSKAISYEKLTAVLVEALKEQNKKIKELEARIDNLNGK
jgi:trimeric autotransporter adhesin